MTTTLSVSPSLRLSVANLWPVEHARIDNLLPLTFFKGLIMIAIVDYQMGNLRSVQKAFEKVGHAAEITSDPRVLARADRIVLPGVGAFCDAMNELRHRHLIAPLREAIDAGKPFLGICLGLQLLFDVSYEDGQHEGLGIIPGKVLRFEVPPQYKVPHMGWNQARIVRRAPILEGVRQQAYFYFVHSYYVAPHDAGVIAIETDYHRPFCAMVWRNNVFATQFHPEKSQADGLQILRNFAELLPRGEPDCDVREERGRRS